MLASLGAARLIFIEETPELAGMTYGCEDVEIVRNPDPDARSRGAKLAFYVTSHGFGHLNRTVAVINHVPADLPVVIGSHPNLFPHWRERLTRPAELAGHVSDAGAVNPPGDSTATDGPATLELAARVHAEAMARVDEEARWLRDERVAALLCDAPAVPLVAARRAYRQATTVFRAEPALRMAWLPGQVNVGMVANPGRDRRKELRGLLGLSSKEKLIYFYVGRYGQNDLDWGRLETYAAKGVHFVGYHSAPAGPLKNLHLLSPSEWHGSDLIASTDALVAKAGYGTVCEAMAGNTPIVYPPRRGFSEFRALDRSLRSWGGGIPVSARDFRELRLDRALDRAFHLGPLTPPFPTDGAARVARHLAGLCRPVSNRQLEQSAG